MIELADSNKGTVLGYQVACVLQTSPNCTVPAHTEKPGENQYQDPFPFRWLSFIA